jgi:phosphoribosyl 1,2-cyclic phosphodiesterase
MRLTILGSSSAGNCYILHNDTEALILEAGLKFAEVKEALNFQTSRIVGLLVTHEHGDHAGYLQEYIKAGIPVCASLGTLSAKGIDANVIKPTQAEKTAIFGGFRIMPFNVVHDCKEPFGFLINHPETGTVLFATDTAEIPYNFAGLNNLLIEANYSDEIVYDNIYKGKLNAKHQERVMQSHMSIATCERFLRDNDMKGVNNIVLIHLSDGNSNAVQFRERIARATGKTVHVADKNMTIEFNKSPF